MKNLLILIIVAQFGLTLAIAADTNTPSATAPLIGPSRAEMALHEDAIEFQIESGLMTDVGNKLNYTLAPQILSLNWNLDDISGDWLRGNTQLKFSGFFTPITDGPENHLEGVAFGPQYNFVQPGWNWVPYIGARVGVGFIDSTNVRYAQGQDFVFTFMVTTGVRYYVDEHWSVAFAGNYEHVSNGGLSEPQRANNGLDVVGPQVSVTYNY
jgi:hypothetical protein